MRPAHPPTPRKIACVVVRLPRNGFCARWRSCSQKAGVTGRRWCPGIHHQDVIANALPVREALRKLGDSVSGKQQEVVEVNGVGLAHSAGPRPGKISAATASSGSVGRSRTAFGEDHPGLRSRFAAVRSASRMAGRFDHVLVIIPDTNAPVTGSSKQLATSTGNLCVVGPTDRPGDLRWRGRMRGHCSRFPAGTSPGRPYEARAEYRSTQVVVIPEAAKRRHSGGKSPPVGIETVNCDQGG